MKYFLIILIFFIGCNDEKTKKPVYVKDVIKTENINSVKKEKENTFFIIKDLKFNMINPNKITYSFKKKTILFFGNNDKFSKLQIKDLKKLNTKFYKINNPLLINYFKITNFPTIIITKDNNHIRKYEGLIPSEILKYEIKD